MPPDFIKGSSKAGLRGDMVTLFDWLVGQIDEALHRLNVLEDTLIIITSDNGAKVTDYFGNSWGHKANGDLRGQKADIWDGGHREPFIVRWPDQVAAGSTSHQLVCLGDLMATCAAILGVDLPDGAGPDSFDILPILRGREQAVRDSLVHHSWDGMFSVRHGAWKLIEGLGSGGFTEPVRIDARPEGPTGQLYNIQEDIAEQDNLWLAYPEIVVELNRVLAAIIEKPGA